VVRVTVLGSGDAFGSGGRLHSGYLVEGRTRTFLLDCGPSILQALKRVERDPGAIDFVLLSHLHGSTDTRQVHHVALDGPGCVLPHAASEVAPERAVLRNEPLHQHRAEHLAQLGRSQKTEGGVVDRQEHAVKADAHEARGLLLDEADQMCGGSDGIARCDVSGDWVWDQGEQIHSQASASIFRTLGFRGIMRLYMTLRNFTTHFLKRVPYGRYKGNLQVRCVTASGDALGP